MEILSVEKLNFSYPDVKEKALSDISFSVGSGDFVLLCGTTGSGKTTLLKMLKKEIAPFGEKTGNILFYGEDIAKSAPADIGFVMQNPENQIVCDKVWHELAFGLENMGVKSSDIRRRTAEMASYFGISEWFKMNTSELSGGQKQILNLASVMVMNPKLLLLDEPTSQLDPLASVSFINTLKRINADFGTAIIICEHRTEEIMPAVNKLMLIDKGKITAYGSVVSVCESRKDDVCFSFFPAPSRIWKSTGAYGKCPLNVKEGREYLENNFNNNLRTAEAKHFNPDGNIALKCKNLCFRYSRNSEDVIKDLNMSVYKGEIHTVLGANGAGKSTLLKLLAGILKPYKGRVKTQSEKRISMLPQNVRTVFLKDTVYDDFNEYCLSLGLNENEKSIRINKVIDTLGISALMNRHPFDLSGGEQQKCAVAKLLLAKPDIILMDEPVKSLDCFAKENVADIIKTLSENGVTVITVTHDIEFAAQVSDRCSLLFGGEITACGEPDGFFTDNNFYTTAAARLSRGFFENTVTENDVIKLCLENGRKEKHGEA